ncbi:MAG TPA: DUF1287 domain-containing protein [Pyrinomonadaceae bacterium]
MRTRKSIACATLLLAIFSAFACRQSSNQPTTSRVRPLAANSSPALKSVVEAALEQTKYTRYYDQSYTKISYPGGDVPLERGACTDVIIRAFRKGGVDLQKEVHEDMEQNFAAYPAKWGLKSPDPNIDHRRVPNLRTFFERKGKSLPVTNRAEDYLPGDVVTWDLGGGSDHIGVVTNLWSDETQNYLIVHNMGGGAKVENVLFAWRITGHYRYF